MNLRDERARVYQDMRTLLDDTADAGMSAEQAESYGRMEAEVRRLTEDIEARDRAEALAERMEQPRPVDEAITRGHAQKFTDEQKEYERAFNRYLRGDRGAAQYLTRDQNVGTDTDGGFTVPDQFRNKLVDRLLAFGGLASVAETITTAGGNPLQWVTLDDTANSGVIAAEGAAGSSGDDLVFGEKTLGAFKYVAPGADNGGVDPLRVSVELLQDSAFDIQSLVVRKLGERIARSQAVHWVTGTGSGQPDGITNGAADFTFPVGQSTTVDKDSLIDLLHTLDPAYRANAVWLFSDDTLAEIRKMEDTNGRPLWLPSADSGLITAPGGVLLGHRVIIDQAVPDMAANAKSIVFGDMSESYVIRRVRDLQLIVDPYTRAANGQVTFTLWARADGTVQNDNSFVIGANSAT